MKNILVAALVCAGSVAHGQVDPDCEVVAELAQTTAYARLAGVPLYDLIRDAQLHPWESQEHEDFVIQIMSSIYASNLAPREAWAVTYGACVRIVMEGDQ